MVSPLHKTLLKTIANLGAMKRSAALKMLQEICEKYEKEQPDEEKMDKMIDEINQQISRFDQRISNFVFNLDGPHAGSYLVFAYTSESNIALQQQSYAENEVDYFKVLVRALMEKDSQSLEAIEASNLASKVTVKALPKARAEQLLDKWTKEFYFVCINGHYYFGPKALVEFSPYFQQHYKEKCVQCEICKHLVFWGVSCAHCDVDIHQECIQKYLMHVKTCPKCGKEWQEK